MMSVKTKMLGSADHALIHLREKSGIFFSPSLFPKDLRTKMQQNTFFFSPYGVLVSYHLKKQEKKKIVTLSRYVL